MSREWNAVSYDALPLPHTQWGRRTIDRLDLTGGETVLDAGCGTGRDAELLFSRLGHGHVIAVDGSRRMLDQAQARLAAHAGRLDVVHADLTGTPPLADLIGDRAGHVDAVISVAAFHWIADHAILFARLRAVMRDGAQFAADCGGAGNIAGVRAAIDQVLGPQPSPWNFAGADETRDRLEKAGFEGIEAQLRADPVRFDDPAQLREYLRTVVGGGHLDRLPEDEHDEFIDAVAKALPEPVIDYVRLEFTARAAGTASARP